MSHPPPCKSGETLWDGECHAINTFEMFKLENTYNAVLNFESPGLLPLLAQSFGPNAEMTVKKSSGNLTVSLNALTHSDAMELLSRFKPADINNDTVA